MNTKEQVISKLKHLTKHRYVEILDSGNSAIWSALNYVSEKVLIPEEGGWLTYKKYPEQLRIKSSEIKTQEAIIDLEELGEKSKTADALLYQNPGGYFAEQPMREIYQICKKNGCLVILDVSGGIGTKLCDGKYADLMVGSFGKWKLVEAGVGGFISTNNAKIFNQLKKTFKILSDQPRLEKILEKLNQLPERVRFLSEKRKKIIRDLSQFNILNQKHLGFVVVIAYQTKTEKDKIIKYCKEHQLEWTECPRYIRVNKKAISIEVKRL